MSGSRGFWDFFFVLLRFCSAFKRRNPFLYSVFSLLLDLLLANWFIFSFPLIHVSLDYSGS